MNDQRIAVLTDTGSDCPADFAAAHDVRVVPLRINYSDGTSYESGVDISTEEVVRRFEQEIPKTSLPSPERIADELARAKADGYKAAVFVSISSGLSATCDTVRMVARTMDDFPVIVIDTLEIGVAAGEAERRAKEMLDYFRLQEELWDIYPQTFSGGERLRLNLAHAMVKRPRLMLLDEPTASLDNKTKVLVKDILQQLKEEKTSMLGIFHDLEFMEGVCDKVFNMSEGSFA